MIILLYNCEDYGSGWMISINILNFPQYVNPNNCTLIDFKPKIKKYSKIIVVDGWTIIKPFSEHLGA